MSDLIVTGSAGLIGSEAVGFFHEQGFTIHGIDNDMRKNFFGKEASTAWKVSELQRKYRQYNHYDLDIRNEEGIHSLFQKLNKNIKLIIHTAAQPSHDWAAKDPGTDFSINATGTLNLLEATRKYCPEAAFIFTSTNKVYGDTPNFLPLVEGSTRYEVDPSHPFFQFGIDESMSIDSSKHSLFGVSKTAADLLVQEYGRYFGMKTVCFRGGCLTGPSHSGAELHGFLSYLVKCALTKTPYKIFGYKGKQVRDNIHSYDLISAFWHFFQNPRSGEIYNIGGSRHSNCSILEVIAKIEKLTNREMIFSFSDEARSGDHQWWISDVRKFQKHYPGWKYQYNFDQILGDIVSSMDQRLGEVKRRNLVNP